MNRLPVGAVLSNLHAMADSSDLVERRQRYIQRQAELHAETVNVQLKSRRPEGRGMANRHGMPQLPIGQHAVKNWPVLDLGHHPRIGLDVWRLEIGGLVENPLSLKWRDFLELPQTDDVSDFHCVTTWSRFDNHWSGVRFKTIAEIVVPHENAQYVLCSSYDVEPGTATPYSTNLSLARAIEDDVLLVHTWEGQPLPSEHGGPCRMITPKLYAWKGAKWIRRIQFLAQEQKGFWEIRGYSNTAEPWYNDRYSSEDTVSTSLPPR
jgi:DMSO/TMAO reductase YedYZ molybdopterin-dependent catalytic subunit